MASWPTSIPITLENYSETAPSRVVRSSMDVGPQKTRRRSSAQVRPVMLSLFLTPAQLATFDEFYLDNDSLVFDFIDPRTEAGVRARFSEAPSYSLNQTMWAVSVKLEYLP